MPKPIKPGQPEISEVEATEVKEPAALADVSSAPKPSENAEFNSLKQKAIAEVKKSENSGELGEPGGMIAGRTASYSGNDGSITGSLSSTPGASQRTRDNTRFGKKIETTSRKVSELGSEQVDVNVVGPKTLHENRGAVQGAKGVVRNRITARTKVKGKAPASHMFQRSLDILEKDNVVFGVGQVIKGSSNYRDTPKTTMIYDDSTRTWVEGSKVLSPRGNYIPRFLKFKINANGVVTDLKFESDAIPVTGYSEGVINKSAPHAKTHANAVELQRRIMLDKAGDESQAGWSPLPAAIPESNEILSFMKDLEQDTGNAAYMSHRMLSLSLAYQINRAGKDGNVQGQPVDEMFRKVLNGARDFNNLRSSVQHTVGKGATLDMLAGSPALILNAFDSTTKYKTKGDVLTMPNSFKSLLFGGQGYMKSLRANKQLVKLMENTQLISTLDGDYDGIKPVFQDDSYVMVTPFNWDELFSIKDATGYDPYQFNNGVTYAFKDHRGTYYSTVNHPLLKGIYDWISEKAGSLRNALGDSKDDEVTIPIVYSLTSVTTWELIVMGAMSKIELARNTSMRDLISYEKNHGQIFDDLLSLNGYPTTASRAFRFDSIDEPITIGKVPEDIAHRVTMPELFWTYDEKTGESDSTQNVVLPWYFSEEEMSNDGIQRVISDPYKNVVNFPMVRSGIVLDSLLNLVNQDERQVRLGLDRLVVPLSESHPYSEFKVYKWDLSADGTPSIVLKKNFTVGDFLSQPRELGLIITAPAGYVTPNGGDAQLTDRWRADSSWRAKIYTGNLNDGLYVNNDGNPFDNGQINIDRGSVYFQEFYYVQAIYGQANKFGGVSLGLKDILNWNVDGDQATVNEQAAVAFRPFTNFGTNQNQTPANDDDSLILSFHLINWSRTQLNPFIISPFDVIKPDDRVGEDGQKLDIFDHAYTFGLVGFAASDYAEDHFNRMNKQIQEGYQFLEDIYLIDSPLVKE